MTVVSGKDFICTIGVSIIDAIQATWEYLYKVVVLSNKSLERIDLYAETHTDKELASYGLRCVHYGHCIIII